MVELFSFSLMSGKESFLLVFANFFMMFYLMLTELCEAGSWAFWKLIIEESRFISLEAEMVPFLSLVVGAVFSRKDLLMGLYEVRSYFICEPRLGRAKL